MLPTIQLPVILTDKQFLCLLYSLLICLIFSSGAYNRDQPEYFRNTLVCASWAKMRSPRARNCCWRSRLDPKSNPLLKSANSSVHKSRMMMFTTVWKTLEMSCWALASGGLEGVDTLKKSGFRFWDWPSIPSLEWPGSAGMCSENNERCGKYLGSCTAHSISVAVQIKAPNIFSIYFSIQSTSWIKSCRRLRKD